MQCAAESCRGPSCESWHLREDGAQKEKHPDLDERERTPDLRGDSARLRTRALQHGAVPPQVPRFQLLAPLFGS